MEEPKPLKVLFEFDKEEFVHQKTLENKLSLANLHKALCYKVKRLQ